MRLVICGTDTDVGKTVVSALVVQGLGARYWKPVQSGLEGGGDSGRVRQLLQLPEERLLPEAYRLQAPVSPHWAAERMGVTIDAERLALPDQRQALTTLDDLCACLQREGLGSPAVIVVGDVLQGLLSLQAPSTTEAVRHAG